MNKLGQPARPPHVQQAARALAVHFSYIELIDTLVERRSRRFD